ncbi:hypothetical protein BC937DRAFT_89504 [Endogone sp. FLAS-F59071]|nr:hypothetical protein BC937DRAFT_89504 [Endogone sp. FLAS-F59071]|eukprot:RUS17777.1 hypothetical protein BC937DRAFT_89504 [Endogone sp. FLAS-F59071]
MTLSENIVDYSNKKILAPMSNASAFNPLGASRYLADAAAGFGLFYISPHSLDLVYTPETVDKRIIGSTRSYNASIGTIDYWKDGQLNFRTHPSEKSCVIFQIGTADPDLALQAALTVAQDVAGIDVNCGCPKKFSLQGGMGAALLSKPEVLKKILTNLVQNCGRPVTCKIRILETKDKTLELVRMIETTGVRALAVHCRTKDMRSSEKAQWGILSDIVNAVRTIPIIANGDIWCYDDIDKIKKLTNVSSVMIARGAQTNPSVFRMEGFLPYDEVVKAYLKKCVDTDNSYQNSKYTLLEMYTESKHTKAPEYRLMSKAKSLRELCSIFGIESYFDEQQMVHTARSIMTTPATPSTPQGENVAPGPLPKNQILVIGRRGVGKLALIIKILNASSSTLSPSVPSLTDPAGHAGLFVPWRIDTKSYSADVQFWINEIEDGDVGLKALRQYKGETNNVISMPNSIVFVFRKDQPETFKDLQGWVAFVRKHELATALCVGVSSNLRLMVDGIEARREKERAIAQAQGKEQGYEDWCLQNGFEYIDIDERQAGDEDSAQSKQVGLARVLEALRPNTWNCMTAKVAVSVDLNPLERTQRSDKEEREQRSGAILRYLCIGDSY